MTDYEILLMLDPELPDDRQNEIVARTQDLIEKSGGKWDTHQPWGRRRLAYEIAKKPDGVYHLVVFECGAETLDEISRVLKIDDGVLRHLATRHVEGSRTSAPRDDAQPAAPPPPAPAPPPVAAATEPEPEPAAAAVPAADYAEGEEANTRSDEE